MALSYASAQDGPVLELIEVKPSAAPAGVTVTDGSVVLSQPNYQGQMTWSAMPKRIDASGFTLTMNVAAQASAGNYYAEVGAHIGGIFTVEPASPFVGAFVNAGESKSDSLTITVVPQAGLSVGSTTTINVGASHLAGVDYIYSVVDPSIGRDEDDDGTDEDDGEDEDDGTDDDDDQEPERRLAASLECPPSIIISELPSLNCHIVITSWRYSADPVQVILPGALDAYGNHANGLQLLQAAGSQDVFNWSAPYRWGMFVFACPSQSGTGANCFGGVTPPGPQSVRILVRQGNDEVPLRLDIRAIPRPGTEANACGFTIGRTIFAKWLQTGGEGGALGCATADEQDALPSPSGLAARQALFQGGVVVLHASGPRADRAFEVRGCIANLYLGMGGTASLLGLPVSDEYNIAGGRRSDFEGGYVAWDQLTGGCILMRDGAANFSLEPQTNRGGSDLLSFDAIGDKVEICRDACAANSSCVAYTYVKPGVQGPRARCWLKSSVPPAAGDGACCTSGVKR